MNMKMNEKKNKGLSLEALENELRQMPQPAVPVELENKLLTGIPAAKHVPIAWYQTRLVRAAVAAVVVMGVLGLFAWMTGGNSTANISFAQVLEQVEKSQTVVYTVTQTEADGRITVMRGAYMNPGLLRWDMGANGIHIVDFQNKKTLVLDPIKKTGRILEIDASSSPLNIIEEMKNFRDGSETILGVRKIDGQKAVGFKFHKHARTGEVVEYTVWADVQTNLPIRTEGKIVHSDKTGEVIVTGIKVTGIEFDVELDKSLFSLEPEGYTIEPGNVKMGYETIR